MGRGRRGGERVARAVPLVFVRFGRRTGVIAKRQSGQRGEARLHRPFHHGTLLCLSTLFSLRRISSRFSLAPSLSHTPHLSKASRSAFEFNYSRSTVEMSISGGDICGQNRSHRSVTVRKLYFSAVPFWFARSLSPFIYRRADGRTMFVDQNVNICLARAMTITITGPRKHFIQHQQFLTSSTVFRVLHSFPHSSPSCFLESNTKK